MHPLKRSHNALDIHLDPVSRATPKWQIVALCFPSSWMTQGPYFPNFDTGYTSCDNSLQIFRKRTPFARFTALNNLPIHHRSPAIEPCCKFPRALNRIHRSHIAHGTGHTFLFEVLLRALLSGCPWGQRSIKSYLPTMSKKDKMVDRPPRGFCVSHSPFYEANFCAERTSHFRSSSEQFRRRFKTETKLLRAVIGPISTPHDYQNSVFSWGS